MEAAWFALHDAYIANPTTENSCPIGHAVDTHTHVREIWVEERGQRNSVAARFGRAQLKSLLLAQHLFLLEDSGANSTHFFDPSKHIQ